MRARGGDSTGLDAVTPFTPASGLTATGGVISDYTSGDTVYRAHIFTSSGTFEVESIGTFGDTVEYLVVAGAGGGGGGFYGGGGGAGGVRTNLSGHPLATNNPSFSVSTTGGIISDYNTPPGAVYRAHIFTSSDTFDVSAIGTFGDTVEYLVVAGAGGGGGGYYGGGGGAGGVRTNLSGHPLATGNPSFSVSTTGGDGSGSYTVTIGGGGAGGYYPGGSLTNNGNDASQGIDSYFGPPSTPAGITAKGGGKGCLLYTSDAADE